MNYATAILQHNGSASPIGPRFSMAWLANAFAQDFNEREAKKNSGLRCPYIVRITLKPGVIIEEPKP